MTQVEIGIGVGVACVMATPWFVTWLMRNAATSRGEFVHAAMPPSEALAVVAGLQRRSAVYRGLVTAPPVVVALSAPVLMGVAYVYRPRQQFRPEELVLAGFCILIAFGFVFAKPRFASTPGDAFRQRVAAALTMKNDEVAWAYAYSGTRSASHLDFLDGQKLYVICSDAEAKMLESLVQTNNPDAYIGLERGEEFSALRERRS